ncbi:acetylornithine deacetylase ArgE [Rhizobium leguminosarum bv. trifolii WSM597]|uniref:Acetylornithine deacetylase ArgE n=1 Tax=Rhizobium leguminosarum bv. trifolii WSM597 TaxID=754764 RepID=J0H9J2_RHILT|nr:acetylornithine deacetylase [Rhizobium leguminosarum]EJB07023.1 acetylornithine deacetylase ArgE [Rhizobium leguminosarum bv. trifolii WSM597]
MEYSTATEILEKLIGFDSVSHKSNLEIVDYIARSGEAMGARIERFPSPDRQKEALLIRFGAPGPGGILLSGHMDVVPVTDQVWTSDPFQLRRDNGRLYGRGAVDMKGFLALCLSCAKGLDLDKLQRPLYLAFSYDEEVTCDGVKPIVAHLKENVPDLACAVVGEPTAMKIVGAHKGAVDWNVRVHGKAAHSSLPHLGSNAIHAAARLVQLVDLIAKEFAHRPVPEAALFDVPFTTLSVGLIKGGSAGNVIAPECEFHIEARPLAAEDKEHILAKLTQLLDSEVLPGMRRTFAEASVSITEIDSILPLVREAASPAERLIGEIAGSDDIQAVSYATEAGFFQTAGIPTVVFGPGSIAQAHQPDEYITESQFAAGGRFLERLAGTLI